MRPLGRVGDRDRWVFGESCGGGGGFNGSAQQMEVRCGMLSIRLVELEERMGGEGAATVAAAELAPA